MSDAVPRRRTPSGEARKRHGVWLTPPPLARFVVREADAALRAVTGQGLAAWARSGPERFALVEPACGDGVFVEALAQHVAPDDPSHTVTAFDIRAEAVDACRARARDCGLRAGTFAPCDALSDDGLAHWPRPSECLLVLGNPPWFGRAALRDDRLARHMRGEDAGDGAGSHDWFHVPGERNPKWLNDVYLRFLHAAQWQILRTGAGVCAFVLNHGLLDHPTLRAARESLARSFDLVRVVDLHGGAIRHERAPDGSRDGNVFGVAQGVCVVVLGRRRGGGGADRVHHAELWGPGPGKLDALDAGPLATREVALHPPFHAWTPRASVALAGTSALPTLVDAMPIQSPCIVSGRDALVVDADRERLLGRLHAMRDPTLDDGTWRARFLLARDRLDVARARARLAEPAVVQRVLYRPFDVRHWLHATALIERPRTSMLAWFARPGALGLISRRRMVPSLPRAFSLVTALPPFDGVIRSDNQGSECVHPARDGDGVPNLSPAIRARFAPCVGGGDEALQPEDFIAWMYALLHAAPYRDLYRDALCMASPPVLAPEDRESWARIVALGRTLVDAHLRAARPDDDEDCAPAHDGRLDPDWRVGVHRPSEKYLSSRAPSLAPEVRARRLAWIAWANARTLSVSAELAATIRIRENDGRVAHRSA